MAVLSDQRMFSRPGKNILTDEFKRIFAESEFTSKEEFIKDRCFKRMVSRGQCLLFNGRDEKHVGARIDGNSTAIIFRFELVCINCMLLSEHFGCFPAGDARAEDD